MSLPLPRFYAHITRIHDQAAVDQAVRQAADTTPTTVQRATLPGDNRRLRGIPAVARGVAGVSPGTDPYAATERKMRPR